MFESKLTFRLKICLNWMKNLLHQPVLSENNSIVRTLENSKSISTNNPKQNKENRVAKLNKTIKESEKLAKMATSDAQPLKSQIVTQPQPNSLPCFLLFPPSSLQSLSLFPFSLSSLILCLLLSCFCNATRWRAHPAKDFSQTFLFCFY